MRATTSVQIASDGFLGGSLNGEFGPDALFTVAGFGRTNLNPYFNLNFDPNDMIVFGAGAKPDDRTSLSAFRVQDDRLATLTGMHFPVKALNQRLTRT